MVDLAGAQVGAREVARLMRETPGVADIQISREENYPQFTVVVDTVEDGRPVARSYREAPEIDGVIVLDRGRPGKWLRARVTASYGNELAGEVVG